MIKSILFKEYIKCRWLLLVMSVVLAGGIGYVLIDVSRMIRLSSATQIWEMVIQNGVTFVELFNFLPLIGGVLLGVVQFVPEMINKRLKLTLHLPMAESKILLSMLMFGLISLMVLFALTYTAVSVGLRNYFSYEIVHWNLHMLLPWLLGGIISYLITAWICMEPVWKQRIFDAVIGVLMVSLFYLKAVPGAYGPLLGYLVVLTIASISFSFYSLIRFKDGEQ
jgi:hypothetical protein